VSPSLLIDHGLAESRPRSPRRRWPSRPDLCERWSARLVATAAEGRRCYRGLIKTLDWISERPPRGGSFFARQAHFHIRCNRKLAGALIGWLAPGRERHSSNGDAEREARNREPMRQDPLLSLAPGRRRCLQKNEADPAQAKGIGPGEVPKALEGLSGGTIESPSRVRFGLARRN
jgi:hypothetical protein